MTFRKALSEPRHNKNVRKPKAQVSHDKRHVNLDRKICQRLGHCTFLQKILPLYLSNSHSFNRGRPSLPKLPQVDSPLNFMIFIAPRPPLKSFRNTTKTTRQCLGVIKIMFASHPCMFISTLQHKNTFRH